jgi:PPK2 family polyphosphate:nucleotide phosphotransferase
MPQNFYTPIVHPMSQPLTPPALATVKLADFDTRYIEGDWTKLTAQARVRENTEVSAELAFRLWAENRRTILLVLQGMDTSGKDGTIRKVTTGMNPMGFRITAFKQPTPEEARHDFLWRIHRAAPPYGEIGIFNRSHYEDVVIVRVHKLVPKSVWQARYKLINEFEAMLVENRTTIVKCFLHISKEEQKKRLEARLKDPTRRWKFSIGDLEERKFWNAYQQAYEDALAKCNTKHAPWHIVPADRKWYRDLVISTLLRQTLEKMNPQFPAEEPGLEKVVIK